MDHRFDCNSIQSAPKSRHQLERWYLSYYDFRESLLHKKSGGDIISWLIVPPQPAEQRFFIRYQIISSETERAAGGWQIVNENGQVRIIDSK